MRGRAGIALDLDHRLGLARVVRSKPCGFRVVCLLIDRKESGAPGDFDKMQTADKVMALVRAELGDAAAAALAAALARDEPSGEATMDLPDEVRE